MENIRGNSIDHRVVTRARFQFDESERALRSGLRTVYPEDCRFELRRRLRDIVGSKTIEPGPETEYVDCPLAVIVTAPRAVDVVAIAVFLDDIRNEQLESARQFCRQRKIRLFPVERLPVYHHRFLHRVAEAESIGLDMELMPRLVPEARCPECGGPLIHRIKMPTSRRNGLFYTCALYLEDSRGISACSGGFLCGADEIHQYIHPYHDVLMTRLALEVEEAETAGDDGDGFDGASSVS